VLVEVVVEVPVDVVDEVVEAEAGPTVLPCRFFTLNTRSKVRTWAPSARVMVLPRQSVMLRALPDALRTAVLLFRLRTSRHTRTDTTCCQPVRV